MCLGATYQRSCVAGISFCTSVVGVGGSLAMLAVLVLMVLFDALAVFLDEALLARLFFGVAGAAEGFGAEGRRGGFGRGTAVAGFGAFADRRGDLGPGGGGPPVGRHRRQAHPV